MIGSITFWLNNILLGIGLSMDAFSVSIANGLNESQITKRKLFGSSMVFAIFQGLMPMLGWVCVHTIITYFQIFEKFIPWIAFVLLGFIGGKMLIEGCKKPDPTVIAKKKLKFGTILIQGIATSIDALSVGFTIAAYNWYTALAAAGIIMLITFLICLCGVIIGKKFSNRPSNRTPIVGGLILIGIGLEILLSSFF